MKTSKKILAIALSVLLILSVMPFAAFAATTTTVSTVTEFETAVANASAGDTVKLLADIDFTVYPAFTRHTLDLTGVTLDLDGHTITGYNHSVVYVGDNFTIKNGKMVCVYDSVNNKKESYAAVIYPQEGNWQTDVVTDKSTGVVLENLVLTGGINCFGADVTVRGENTNVTGNYYYALWADVLATLTVEDGTFTSAASSTNGIIGACSDAGKEAYVYISGGDYTVPAGKNLVLQSTMASSQQLVEISGGTYNVVVPAKACAEGFVPVTEPDAQGKYTVAVDTAVAEVNGVKYDTLEEAIAAANAGDTVKLLADVTVNTGSASTSRLAISKSLTIDGSNHTVTINNRGFGVGMNATAPIDVTFKDITIINTSNAGRCIDTRGNLNSLTLDNANLKTTGTSGYLQPLTIGGNQSTPATVNITGSTIQTSDDGSKGYAIITFNPVTMNIDESTIKGWACVYAKGPDGSAGSAGSVFNITDSTLISKNVNSGTTNDFSMLMAEDDDVTFNITGSDIQISATGDQPQAIGAVNDTSLTDVAVNLGAGNNVTLEGNAIFAINTDDVKVSGGTFNVVVPAENCAEGFVPVTEPNEQGKYTVAVVQYGTIEQMTGATITGNGTAHEKISIENTTMSYAEPDYSVGRYYAGYYLSGVKFVAPEGTVISENARYTNGSVDAQTGQLKVKNLYTAKDGANFMYSWPHVTEESLKEAIAAGVNKTWTYTFDWDGDGYFEQEAIIEIVCDTVTLVKDGEQVYPVVANNGSSLTLTDGVKFNAYIDADAYGVDANEAVVKLTYNHNADVSQTKAFSTDTIALTDATKYVKAGDPYDGTYKFAFAVAPAQYAENITIELYATADAETPLFTTTTNVKSMCEKVIALAETESAYAAYANLCKALADYCQAAQVFFSYDAPAAPAYYNDAVTTLAAADMEVPTAFVGIEAAGFSFTIVSALEVNVFYNGDLDIQNVSIDSTKGADAVNAEITTKSGSNCINITGIASGNLDNVITVNTSAGVVELSATNIAKAIARSADTNYANLARALYLYSVQASAFFGA